MILFNIQKNSRTCIMAWANVRAWTTDKAKAWAGVKGMIGTWTWARAFAWTRDLIGIII
jgi:hypothetical protein